MKKILVPFILLSVIGCTVNIEVDEPVKLDQQEITITATSGEPDTRTERAADGSVLWSPGDQISLFYGSGENGGSCFTAQNTVTAKTVNFTGTIGVITGGNNIAVKDTYFWAVYPYNAAASCDGNSITTVLPVEQVATADTFADDLFPSIGRSQGLNMAFYNICGGIKFTVSEEGIKRVSLRGNSDEIIAGKITVGFDDSGFPAVTSIADGAKVVSLEAPVGESFEVGKAYFMVFLPTVFENGFTLTFDKGNVQAKKVRTAKTTIRRSVFGSLTTPDKDLEWSMLYVPIPDRQFREYMLKSFDTNGNGELDFDEAEAVTYMNFMTHDIESVVGIEHCPHLKTLYCRGTETNHGKLKSLNISNNQELTDLYCYYNELQSLDVSANSLLKSIHCQYNQLTSLDLPNSISLKSVYCNNNLLTSLDVSANTAMTYLNCGDNQLTSLDLGANTILTSLYCDNNQLTSLDVHTNTVLSNLQCYKNRLTNLDLSANTALDYLSCSNNQLTSLDVSANTALTGLSCVGNQLTSLDVSANTALSRLYCSNNQLTSLDVSFNTDLQTLKCRENPNLAEIWINANQYIEALDYDDSLTTIRYKGLSGEPVSVSTAEEFELFLANSNSYVKLVADINLSGRNIDLTDSFDGVLDGQGHYISGLQSGTPLFNVLNGTVKNLIIDSSCHFAPEVPVFGIIAGENNGVITDITNKGDVSYSVESIPAPVLIAAIAGMSSRPIANCVNEGRVAIESAGAVVGLGIAGIVAYQSASLKNCTNRGEVSFSAASISSKADVVDATGVLPSLGGVAAIGAPGFSMNDCDNYGLIKYSLSAAETGMTGNLNRNQIGGVVSSPCGDVRDCNNYGEVNVSLKHSTPGTELPYEFIACVGGIGGGDYLFTSTTGVGSNTRYFNCINEGTIIVDSDASRSNTAIGGIVGWPGQEVNGINTGAYSCVNRGNIIGRGAMKCRIGGVEGGSGAMQSCVNEGKIILESGNIGSAIGSLCGFHTRNHSIWSCSAKGEVISEVEGLNGGVAGLIGNIGNIANNSIFGCIVDCKITVANYDAQTMGMVVGKYNGTSAVVQLGFESSPIEVSGSINGMPASDGIIYGLANSSSNHTIYYVIK